jgi:PAS domain S-box-containing protein
MTPQSDATHRNGDVLDALDAGIVILDEAHCIRTWNNWMERASDVAASALLGRSIWDAFPALHDTRFFSAVEDALETGASSVLTHSLHAQLLPLHMPDSRPLLHNLIVRPFSTGIERHCLIQVNDVTATVERERLLRERRDARYRAVVDTAQDAIVTTDIDGSVQWMNGAAERIFGYSSRDAVGHDIALLLTPDAAARWPRGQDALLLSEAATRPVELDGKRRDGAILNLELSLAHWQGESRTFVTGILRDVTERRRARDALERAVADKTMLLREINHRVKNSLQLVSGLLNLQLATVSDEAARHLLKDASNRISAVARVHHRLYQTDRFRTLDFAAFLNELCDDLAQASGEGTICDIRLEADALDINIDQAAPLGLIANELVTNAIKHRDSDVARIHVELRSHPEALTLTVRDQGPGLPAGFDPAGSCSLGMRIIVALTRQIQGELTILEAPKGAAFRISVPIIPEETDTPLEAGGSRDLS